jgi:predicted RNase H-like HicB family nuclease
MTRVRQFTAVIEREGDGYVALCPELDIASQGDTIEEARRNIQEALEGFIEAASPEEVRERLRSEVYVTSLEVTFG